jgi:hypothetical protein
LQIFFSHFNQLFRASKFGSEVLVLEHLLVGSLEQAIAAIMLAI